MLFGYLHIKDPLPRHITIRRGLPVLTLLAVDRLDAVNTAEGELIGAELHDWAILLVECMDSHGAVAREVDKEYPIARELC